ncbi:hypothetical protein IQ235_09765 [Oscillatoriales cyanobacterium LEGE 11467]|uniref:Uncharacterized protein n=1 Tax=Zarconia navalis LEGE 11467 TaxID=1828826 RepID=A0A928Z801_9CYAN|nr:DUF6464 family protein [Zarconia navalis]MBE9041065.1 hypothetical protein [Zarconia navalis LEGE 11467]
MESDSLPTEIILSKSARSLGKVRIDWHPQPGHYLEYKGKTYAVLERRHRYQFKFGRYRLHKISLYVQCARRPDEKSLVDGRWVVGDANCNYNARSELFRCAVNPEGPCQGCRYYQPRPE